MCVFVSRVEAKLCSLVFELYVVDIDSASSTRVLALGCTAVRRLELSVTLCIKLSMYDFLLL